MPSSILEHLNFLGIQHNKIDNSTLIFVTYVISPLTKKCLPQNCSLFQSLEYKLIAYEIFPKSYFSLPRICNWEFFHQILVH